jgi:hypothetical protein
VYSLFDHITVLGIIGFKREPLVHPPEGIRQHPYGYALTILAVEKGCLVSSSGLESINLLINPVLTTSSYVELVTGWDYSQDFIHQTLSDRLDLKLGEVGVNASAFSNMPIDFRLFRRQKCRGCFC